MRTLVTLLSTTLLATAAFSQQQPTVTPPVAPEGTVQAKAAIAECDRLVAYLEETRPAAPGVTVDEVRQWRQASDSERCRTTLLRFTEASQPGGTQGPTGLPTATSSGLPAAPNSPVSAPAPQAGAPAAPAQPAQSEAGSTSSAQVVVQQLPANVTVRQRQPEIIVRQAPPIITVEQPQPEIIVRMVEPDVNVSVARPEVQVNMPQPTVQVVPPQQQAQTGAGADGQRPNVRFERTGEPQIVYRPAEGQPQVRFESAGQAPSQPNAAAAAGGVSPQGAQAQLNAGQAAPGTASPPAEPAQTGALPQVAAQPVKVSRLEDMEVYDGRGERLGEVDRVVMGTDGKPYVVIKYGGFLGLGDRQVALASDLLALRADRLVAETITDDELRAFPEFKQTDNFKAMDGEETASIRALR